MKKTKNITKIKRKNLNCKIVGISSEKDKSYINLLLGNNNISIGMLDNCCELGDDVRIVVNLEVLKVTKIYSNGSGKQQTM